MIVSTTQQRHFAYASPFKEIAAPACAIIGFILMISGIGIWVSHLMTTHKTNFLPTLLEITSFLILGLGAHIMDLGEKRERSGTAQNGEERGKPPDRPGDCK